jgi:ribosomal protein S18 acetylase RimI-like enzyme
VSPTGPTPRRAEGAPRDELEEILYDVRRELLRREESPAGDWVESTAIDLRSGAKIGFYVPTAEGGGLAFWTRRGPEGYGHVHAGHGADPGAVAEQLARTMLDALPPDVRSIDVGFTGLPPEEEPRVLSALARRPGSSTIQREAMERRITTADAEADVRVPPGLRVVPIREVTLDALADLDWRAFRGTLDERLIGARVEEYRHVLASILEGSLGRFLDEASTALVTEGTAPRLVGALLTCEQTARRAIFVDLMVDPELRRRGYGRFLLAWGLRALRALGHEQVRLWVTVANQPARGLYEVFGFRPTAGATIYRWERPGSEPQPQAGR